MKKLMRPQVLIPISTAVILLLWFFTPPLVALWAKSTSIDVDNYGAFGDLFGVLTSLFTGLAMVGIFLVLYLDGRARRAEKPPVLAPEIRGVTYTPVENEGSHRISLKIDFEIGNVGTSPAFNWRWAQHDISVGAKRFEAQDPSPQKHTSPIPIQSQPQRGNIILELVGNAARTVKEALDRPEAILVHLALAYDGIGTEKWTTACSLRMMHDREQSESLSEAVRLSVEVVPGSWYTGKPR